MRAYAGVLPANIPACGRLDEKPVVRKWFHSKRTSHLHSIYWYLQHQFLPVDLENSVCDSYVCDRDDISSLQQCLGVNWSPFILAIDCIFPSWDVHFSGSHSQIFSYLVLPKHIELGLLDYNICCCCCMHSRHHRWAPSLPAFQVFLLMYVSLYY